MKNAILAAIVIFSASLLLLPSVSSAEGDFKTYHARHSTLWYKGGGDFARFEENLAAGPAKCSVAHGPDSRYLADRVDALFERVEFLLGMYPGDLHVKLALFSDAAELAGEYERLGLSAGLTGPYYSSRGRTLYMSADETSVQAFAKGIARAVTAEHFKASLPSGAMDIIDSYIEEQLSYGY